MFKTIYRHPIAFILLAGYALTVSYEILDYECRDFEIEYGTCTSGAIASGMMQGMVWPFYWVAKLRKQS